MGLSGANTAWFAFWRVVRKELQDNDGEHDRAVVLAFQGASHALVLPWSDPGWSAGREPRLAVRTVRCLSRPPRPPSSPSAPLIHRSDAPAEGVPIDASMSEIEHHIVRHHNGAISAREWIT